MCADTNTFDVFDSWFYVEMMGLIGAGNNPMVGMTVHALLLLKKPANKPHFVGAIHESPAKSI